MISDSSPAAQKLLPPAAPVPPERFPPVPDKPLPEPALIPAFPVPAPELPDMALPRPVPLPAFPDMALPEPLSAPALPDMVLPEPVQIPASPVPALHDGSGTSAAVQTLPLCLFHFQPVRLRFPFRPLPQPVLLQQSVCLVFLFFDSFFSSIPEAQEAFPPGILWIFFLSFLRQNFPVPELLPTPARAVPDALLFFVCAPVHGVLYADHAPAALPYTYHGRPLQVHRYHPRYGTQIRKRISA